MSASFPPETLALLADADLCVKCGLCLPHCPTYELTRHEGESPRGRIALLQGIATGAIPLTEKAGQHLDGCLSCRACETVCPAKVPYGRLMDAGRREMLRRQPDRSRMTRVLAWLLSQPWILRALARPLWLYQRSGLQWLLRRLRLLGSGNLARLESLLPRIELSPSPAAAQRPLPDGEANPIALFTGCLGPLTDAQTLRDALTVFKRLNIAATIPPRQNCCGALHLHSGQRSAALPLAQGNIAAFAGARHIVSCASGCGATLAEYGELLGNDTGGDFASRHEDILAFLSARWPDSLALKPLGLRVAVHTPCTARNVLHSEPSTWELLRRIPGIEPVELDAQQHCCGAAGSYFLTQPDRADRLLARKLDRVGQIKPDLIVSSNIGCTLHLAAGLRRLRSPVGVLHPVSLLARQLA